MAHADAHRNDHGRRFHFYIHSYLHANLDAIIDPDRYAHGDEFGSNFDAVINSNRHYDTVSDSDQWRPSGMARRRYYSGFVQSRLQLWRHDQSSSCRG